MVLALVKYPYHFKLHKQKRAGIILQDSMSRKLGKDFSKCYISNIFWIYCYFYDWDSWIFRRICYTLETLALYRGSRDCERIDASARKPLSDVQILHPEN